MIEKKLLLFGYPVAHSRSPAMHAAALRSVGLSSWTYTAQAVTPEELPLAVKGLRQSEYLGANVTIPHKERIIPLLDQLTAAAEAIGAVNTVYKEGRTLVGDNTDAPGFMADLSSKLILSEGAANLPELTNGESSNSKQADSLPNKAIILGAGGSARAVVYALQRAGWQITLAARRIEQARSIAAAYPPESIRPILLQQAALSEVFLDSEHLNTIKLLVNTTPLGMQPNIESCAWPPELPLPQNAFIYDLVYKPAQTLLLARAQKAGLPHANGLGMLVEQAALSFERWTGFTAPRLIMFQAVQV